MKKMLYALVCAVAVLVACLVLEVPAGRGKGRIVGAHSKYSSSSLTTSASGSLPYAPLHSSSSPVIQLQCCCPCGELLRGMLVTAV